MELFLTTLQQVAVLLIFIFVGYFLRKKEIITEGGKKVLSKLLVYLFAPCYTVMSLSTIVNVRDIVQYIVLLIVGAAVAVVGILLAMLFARVISKEKVQRNILIYGFSFSNIGYFGYPVVAAIFGEVMRAQMMLFCLPMSIAIYTYGYYILTTGITQNATSQKKSWKQRLSFLWAPPMLGCYAGVTLGLLSSGLHFTLPTLLTDVLTIAGNCQSAPAMLLTGAVLAGVPFKKLFTSWRPYAVGAIRLLILPVIVGAVFFAVHLCSATGETFVLAFRLSVIVAALPVGMNTVVFPESVGQDSTEGAKTCFMSYILALGTMPLVFMLMETVAKGF
ncbi:MAG: AEC family transporter [Clostridia bacterium]|nr:AEC family transporter [Clostridia bacterium]